MASQEELALFVGATRESVNQQLQGLKQDGLVELSGGRIHLLEHRRLARLISSAD
ncbi:helix-turn-helix domain-containing protein [Methylobacterium sp. 10]|uniref:helix-turn-helix domain-containing protein n=1 Tax=Methylobacterium sp. 10 TaxID=1101191 RepID=UPI001FDABAAE|nr:helix-turn-helix domain-containing protein [Methylobacterium sp. 10]